MSWEASPAPMPWPSPLQWAYVVVRRRSRVVSARWREMELKTQWQWGIGWSRWPTLTPRVTSCLGLCCHQGPCLGPWPYHNCLCWGLSPMLLENTTDACGLGHRWRPCWCVRTMRLPGHTNLSAQHFHPRSWWHLGLSCSQVPCLGLSHHIGVWGPFCCWGHTNLNGLHCHLDSWCCVGPSCHQGSCLGWWSYLSQDLGWYLLIVLPLGSCHLSENAALFPLLAAAKG